MPSAGALYSTGRWLNANDIVSKVGLNTRITAVIAACDPEEIGGMNSEQKTMLMLSLVSKQNQPWPKKVPLNKGNSLQMINAFGDDYSLWAGNTISIWAENVMFSGKLVPGIKLQGAPAASNGNGNGSPMQQAQQAPSPSPSAAAVTGTPQVAQPTWNTVPRGSQQAQTALEDDEIPF